MLGVVLVLGALLLYERTMARTVRPGDPGEFQLAGAVLGVPRPPGYPLWVLIAHLFVQLVPHGDAIWRISLTSVVYGAATVGLTYLVAQRLGVRWWPAAGAAALFAIAPDFWGQATEPRAYALNTAQVALTLWLLLKWRAAPPERRRPWLAAIGLAVGSALANHGTTLTLLPGYALFILGVEIQTARAARLSDSASVLSPQSSVLAWGRVVRRHIPDYLLAAGAGALGLTPYLLPLVRFLQGGGPYYWGEPQTWADFTRLLSGQDFRHMIFGIPWDKFATQAGWGVQVLLDQYGWPGVLVGLIGWVGLARRQPLMFGLLASGFVFSFVFAIMYDAATNVFYFIPGHLFWALALGMAGEMAVAALTGARWRGVGAGRLARGATAALAVGLIALVAWGVAGRYNTAGWQHDNRWRDQAEIFFREAPPSSIVYVGWEASSVIKYYQVAENRRTDLILKAGNPTDWPGHIRDWLTEGWALYVTEPPTELFSYFKLTPVGFAHRVEFRYPQESPQAYPSAPPPAQPGPLFQAAQPGITERNCAQVGEHATVRSGEFVAGDFQAYRAGWRPNLPADQGKLWWAPLHTDMSGLTLYATLLDDPAVSRVYQFGAAAGSNANGSFYPSAVPLPQPGRWRIVATAGPDWGCFDLAVGP